MCRCVSFIIYDIKIPAQRHLQHRQFSVGSCRLQPQIHSLLLFLPKLEPCYFIYFLLLLSMLPVISAWSRLDEVARDRFWAGHPEDFRRSLYVSAYRRAQGPSPGPGRASFFCKLE